MSPSSQDSVDQNYSRNCLDGKVIVPDNDLADRATSIPMPSYHIRRTDSEAQLCEDMAVAEYRDRCMFNRLITGIRQRQAHQHRLHYESQHHQSQRPDHQIQPQQRSHQQLLPRRIYPVVPTLPLTSGNFHLPKTPKNVNADRTIESIISTRCQSVCQCPRSIPHHNPDTSPITPLDSDDERQRQGQTNVNHHNPNRSNDWAIEGFGLDESPFPSPFTSPISSEKQTLNFIPTHSDHVFDMDL